jgi:hypothetical protein
VEDVLRHVGRNHRDLVILLARAADEQELQETFPAVSVLATLQG